MSPLQPFFHCLSPFAVVARLTHQLYVTRPVRAPTRQRYNMIDGAGTFHEHLTARVSASVPLTFTDVFNIALCKFTGGVALTSATGRVVCSPLAFIGMVALSVSFPLFLYVGSSPSAVFCGYLAFVALIVLTFFSCYTFLVTFPVFTMIYEQLFGGFPHSPVSYIAGRLHTRVN